MKDSSNEGVPPAAKDFIDRHALNEASLDPPVIERDLVPVCMASLLICVHGEYVPSSGKSPKKSS